MTIPVGADRRPRRRIGDKGCAQEQGDGGRGRKNFEAMQPPADAGRSRLAPTLAKLASHVRFMQTRDGLRIDLVDDADYSMFALGTTAAGTRGRGADRADRADRSRATRQPDHDPRPYRQPAAMAIRCAMNNWMLSSGRAEATRRRLALGGMPGTAVLPDRGRRRPRADDREQPRRPAQPPRGDHPAVARGVVQAITLKPFALSLSKGRPSSSARWRGTNYSASTGSARTDLWRPLFGVTSPSWSRSSTCSPPPPRSPPRPSASPSTRRA